MKAKKYAEFHIKLPASLASEAKARAKQQGTSFTKLLENATREYVMRLRLQETRIKVVPVEVLIKKEQKELDELKKELQKEVDAVKQLLRKTDGS